MAHSACSLVATRYRWLLGCWGGADDDVDAESPDAALLLPLLLLPLLLAPLLLPGAGGAESSLPTTLYSSSSNCDSCAHPAMCSPLI
eukprot:CAMPEP_0202882944 /NCGR_PEP_ID=MMETSP1391-20130828/38702_1 /ASSEMBLY_ACC=CAM_ASM_000867 /TAXON_ID=1034604 /ORGANISM="Chlamydomonas leiostraca, Strain SAG 11-49" /LENGTH=86 /DNA_ID=CAMNT_0049565879 /DNA_START=12 /DNA_END=269 /DNA_ORIENTATION=-